MARSTTVGGLPLPAEFLDWQVKLRAWTAQDRKGVPHVGVAPLVLVKQPGIEPGATAHSVVCGLLPRTDLLETKTKEFRSLYESASGEGSQVLYDRGLAYLRRYYASTDDFDPSSLTTLLAEDAPLVKALRAAPECALLFHVFDVGTDAPGGAMRTQQICCRAEVLSSGPVYENVWWHNALFHGFADGVVVVHFHHQRSLDTRFGQLEALRD
jgi:hypothetical protein